MAPPPHEAPMAMNHGYTYRERIRRDGHGVSAVEWLARTYTHTSADGWRERVAAGEVAVDGVVLTADVRLRRGNELAWERAPWEEPDVPLEYRVVHEDDGLLVVDKPAGLPTMPAGGFLEHTLLALVRVHAPEASPMHRLGRFTSGLIVFAKTHSARSAMQAAWRDFAIEKRYRALVEGQLERPPFTIDVPIGPVPHPKLGDVFAASPQGKSAVSHVHVVGPHPLGTLVDVTIDTGRPHQIRIHMASVGHPLVGDPLYGLGGVPSPAALPGDGGYFLHAAYLAFAHPYGGRLELEAPLPEILRAP